ncbi:hypothetical protein [Halocatena marina]|uniref:hypothetical protein n=1 Tax=Halocatena marina TaxID=2934937 RepID=UPI00200DE8B9|nr:hypothetical protein [Halocatena marina]
MTYSTTTEEKGEESSEKQVTDVDFNALAIAGAWEATESVPVCVAVAITNEFTEHTVTAQDGEESDGDVVFKDARILFEEKAVGVCPREIAEQHAQMYVELDRRDKVLAITPAQIFENQPF